MNSSFVTYCGDAVDNRTLTEEFNRLNYSYRERRDNTFWRKRSIRIQERDNERCRRCDHHALHLQTHHCYYRNYPDGLPAVPWDYPDASLITLCDDCHAFEEAHIKIVKAEFLRVVRDRGIKAHDVQLIAHAIRTVPPEIIIRDIVGALWAALSSPVECRRLHRKSEQSIGQNGIDLTVRTKLADVISERGGSHKDFALLISAIKKPKPEITMNDIAAVIWTVLSFESEFARQLKAYRQAKGE